MRLLALPQFFFLFTPKPQTMKIDNPPYPPLVKGGMGGFGNLFSKQD
jgi:hypothetical protein